MLLIMMKNKTMDNLDKPNALCYDGNTILILWKEYDFMIFNGINFDTYLKNYPDEKGYFGNFGGSYVSDELKKAILVD